MITDSIDVTVIVNTARFRGVSSIGLPRLSSAALKPVKTRPLHRLCWRTIRWLIIGSSSSAIGSKYESLYQLVRSSRQTDCASHHRMAAERTSEREAMVLRRDREGRQLAE